MVYPVFKENEGMEPILFSWKKKKEQDKSKF